MNIKSNYENKKADLIAYQKAYYIKNIDKCKAYQREYQKEYRKDVEKMDKKREYMREYNKKYSKIYREKNPEKYKLYIKNYQLKNKERLKEYQKSYNHTLKGKKGMRIANWKQIGVQDTNYSELYDFYIKQNNCWICNEKFKNSKARHLDHDHETGEVRYICCVSCNTTILSNKNN